jgi:aspartate kinase
LNAVLSKKFKVDFEENVTLYTIRHFDDAAAKTVENDKTVLLKQISRETMQIVTKE